MKMCLLLAVCTLADAGYSHSIPSVLSIFAGMDIGPDWSKCISRPHVPSFLMSQSCDTNWDVKHHKSPSNFCPDSTRLKTWSRHDNSNGLSMKVVWKWGHQNLMDYLKVVRWFSLFPHKKGYPIGNILSFQTSMLRKTTIGRGEKHYSIVIVNYWWYYVILIIYILLLLYIIIIIIIIMIIAVIITVLLVLLLVLVLFGVIYIYTQYIMTIIIIAMLLLLLLSLSLLLLYLVVSLLYANVPICVTCMHTSTSQY